MTVIERSPRYFRHFVGTLPPKLEAFMPTGTEDCVTFNNISSADSFTKSFTRRREVTGGITPLGISLASFLRSYT